MKRANLPKNEIIDFYKNGQSCKKISLIYNVSESCVKTYLKLYGIEIKNLRESHLKKKFNENFFDIINTEEKAYWLGFMYADGNIRKNIHKKGYESYVISLNQSEKEPLEKFINSINGKNIKISQRLTKENKLIFSIVLNSKILYNGLNSKGCVPNKSLILKYPANITKKLENHFIRGYFDGDGSVYQLRNMVKFKNHVAIYNSGGITICGTFEFLTELKKRLQFLQNNGKNITKENRRISNTWSLRFDSIKRLTIFYNYLYQDSIIYLQRKKDKFEQIFKERCSTTIIGTPMRTPKVYKEEGIV